MRKISSQKDRKAAISAVLCARIARVVDASIRHPPEVLLTASTFATESVFPPVGTGARAGALGVTLSLSRLEVSPGAVHPA